MIEEVINRAIEVFGTEGKAKDWMEKKSRTLGAAPEKLCETDEGCKKVLFHLHSIEIHDLD